MYEYESEPLNERHHLLHQTQMIWPEKQKLRSPCFCRTTTKNKIFFFFLFVSNGNPSKYVHLLALLCRLCATLYTSLNKWNFLFMSMFLWHEKQHTRGGEKKENQNNKINGIGISDLEKWPNNFADRHIFEQFFNAVNCK